MLIQIMDAFIYGDILRKVCAGFITQLLRQIIFNDGSLYQVSCFMCVPLINNAEFRNDLSFLTYIQTGNNSDSTPRHNQLV